MTVMITKMSEGGASTGTVVIRRNLPGRRKGTDKWSEIGFSVLLCSFSCAPVLLCACVLMHLCACVL